MLHANGNVTGLQRAITEAHGFQKRRKTFAALLEDLFVPVSFEYIDTTKVAGFAMKLSGVDCVEDVFRLNVKNTPETDGYSPQSGTETQQSRKESLCSREIPEPELP
jgi:hypothetical protein